MASFKIAPDFRRRRKDGDSQVVVFVRHENKQRTVPIGIYVREDEWDKSAGLVTSRNAQCRALNIRIKRARLAMEEALVLLPLRASIDQVEAAVKGVLFPDEEQQGGRKKDDRNLLAAVFERFAAMKKPSTRLTYERTLTHIRAYADERTLRFEDVTKAWLMGFDAHMSKKAPSANARAIHMRNLRAVFNYALDEELTANYPFRRYRIKTVETAKRSLSAEDLRRLFAADVEEWQRPYLDFFRLSFFLMGANACDLLHLRPAALYGDRLEFNRAKTARFYSMRVEPEAAEIIARYRGKDYLLNIMEGREDYLQYIRQCNHALKMVGTHSRKGCKTTGEALFPGITTYWARHSWATIAASLDIPKETIAAALGHGGRSVTDIYIDFDRRKVDEANRRVLDWVLYGKQ